MHLRGSSDSFSLSLHTASNNKAPLLGKGEVAAVSADGVVSLSSNPKSEIPSPNKNGRGISTAARIP